MAKKDQENGAETTATEEKPVEKKKLNAEEKKKLFTSYDVIEKKLDDLRKQSETLIAQRSVAVKAIYDALGKGPFSFGGAVLTVVARKPKGGGDGPENYFFRGRGNEEVERIS